MPSTTFKLGRRLCVVADFRIIEWFDSVGEDLPPEIAGVLCCAPADTLRRTLLQQISWVEETLQGAR